MTTEMTWRRVVVVVVALAVGLAQITTYLGVAAVAVVAGEMGRPTPWIIEAMLTVLQYPLFPLWVLIPTWVAELARPLGAWVVYGALIGNALIWGTTFAWATHRLLKVRTSNWDLATR